MVLIKGKTSRIIVRPDAESYDFTQSAFTKDYEYHDLDLSQKMPSGTILVLIWGAFKSSTANAEFSIAPEGYSGTYKKSIRFISVADIAVNIDCLMPVFSGRKIQYRCSAVTYTYINLNIVGAIVI